jgi:Zn-dependent protease
MKGSVKLTTVKGVTVFLHFTFLFFVVWLGVLYITSGMQWTQLLWSVLFLLAVFACLVLHEYGHALVASDLGINAKKITFYPIGGIASGEKLPANPKQELLISLGGPFVSLCIGALLLLFSPQTPSYQIFRRLGDGLNASNFLFTLGVANIGLSVFNLIPAFPMDGGRILRAVLAFKYNYIKATVIAATVGKVIVLATIIGGLVIIDYVMLLVGVLLMLFTQSEESYLQIKVLVKGLRLRDTLMYDYESMEAGVSVREAADILQSYHDKYFVVMYEGRPVGTSGRMDVIKAVSELEYNKVVAELMKEDIKHLQGEMPVEEFLDQFPRNEERIYPVYDEEQFLGVVSFQQVIEYILIHKGSSKAYRKTQSMAELV